MSKFEPDWSEAPEWANYWAVDASGCAFWYEEQPRKGFSDWRCNNDRFRYEKRFIVNNFNWFDSLQERPVEMKAPFETKETDSLSNWESTEQPSAASILKAGLGHMEDRAKTYDAEGGERSMAKTVEAFNALTGRDLTETEGWLMMVCLKLARANQGGFRMDSFEDGAAYMALMGECAAYMESKES